MKRRNLILSLVSSIVLTIALVTVTIVNVVAPKKNDGNTDNSQNVNIVTDINKENDGSKEKPYLIYDAESFTNYVINNGYTEIEQLKDEEGNPVVDEEGNPVYNDSTYLKLNNDIDFAGVDFAPFFNQDKAFNAHLDGNGFSVKNISINVTVDNFDNYITKNANGLYDAKIAIFGTVEDAEITNITFDNVSVDIADDVYPFIADAVFADSKGAAFNELVIGTVAAYAKDSKIQANVNANLNSGSYAIYEDNKVQGFNAIGGVVAISENTEISNSNVNVKLIADSGEKYFVGGVAGYAYDSTIKDTKVNFEVETNYKRVLYIGGVAGFANTINLENDETNLNVVETGERFDLSTLELAQRKDVDAAKVNWVAGIVNVIRANNENQLSTITNVKATSNVDMDCLFAGAVYEVRSTSADTSARYVTFKDVVVDSTVNTLKAYGFANTLKYSTVSYTAPEVDEITGEAKEQTTHIRLVGSVALDKVIDVNDPRLKVVVASGFILNNQNTTIEGGFKSINIEISNEIYSKLEFIETIRQYGSIDRV